MRTVCETAGCVGTTMYGVLWLCQDVLISDRYLSYLLFFVLRVGGLGIGGPFFVLFYRLTFTVILI